MPKQADAPSEDDIRMALINAETIFSKLSEFLDDNSVEIRLLNEQLNIIHSKNDDGIYTSLEERALDVSNTLYFANVTFHKYLCERIDKTISELRKTRNEEYV